MAGTEPFFQIRSREAWGGAEAKAEKVHLRVDSIAALMITHQCIMHNVLVILTACVFHSATESTIKGFFCAHLTLSIFCIAILRAAWFGALQYTIPLVLVIIMFRLQDEQTSLRWSLGGSPCPEPGH
jgi:hypothetical protein